LLALADLPEALAALPDGHDGVLHHGARWVAERFAEEQARRAQMGFNDLLTRLDAALQGPHGERAWPAHPAQFPVALIDEFQDTDPVQYRIFDAVYRVAASDPASALILIGDPKQAIYAFRGADIYTYLAARASHGRAPVHPAGNYRSTLAMVEATNRCFEVAEARAEGQGAFLFRREGADGANPVPFLPAGAAGRKDSLQVAGADAPALNLWQLPALEDDKVYTKGAYLEAMAEVCASEMVRLLKLGGQEGADGVRTPGEDHPACAPDLAVLVNSARGRRLIRQALARRGVRSVYLSDQESVFQRPQAVELQRWLAACAEPDDGRALRAALATPTLGLSWAELDCSITTNSPGRARAAVSVPIASAGAARACCPCCGACSMISGCRRACSPPVAPGSAASPTCCTWPNCSSRPAALLDGEHALIRHLAEQCRTAAMGGRRAPDPPGERTPTWSRWSRCTSPRAWNIRWSSCPSPAPIRAAKATDLPLKWHDDQGRLQVALGDDGTVLAKVDRERLGEDLRKLYVALTRARYATWVGLAPLDGPGKGRLRLSAGGGKPLAPRRAWRRPSRPGAGTAPTSPWSRRPRRQSKRSGPRRQRPLLGTARASRQVVSEPWWIASYSAIGKTLGGGVAVGGAQEDAGGDADGGAARAAAETPTESASWRCRPRGQR
jgi:exodeoxyribonuclease V beta subunit